MLHLAMFTGLRLSDLAVLGRQHIQDGWLVIRPKKTDRSGGISVEIPVLPILSKTIDASPCGDPTFLVSEWNASFTVNGLGNKMRDWCDQAGMPQCSAHGLRKAGATIAAENGATDDKLMAIFGWTTKKQTALYTRKANRRKLAGGAMHKLVPEQNEGKKLTDNSVDESLTKILVGAPAGPLVPKSNRQSKRQLTNHFNTLQEYRQTGLTVGTVP
jgi:integrase